MLDTAAALYRLKGDLTREMWKIIHQALGEKRQLDAEERKKVSAFRAQIQNIKGAIWRIRERA